MGQQYQNIVDIRVYLQIRITNIFQYTFMNSNENFFLFAYVVIFMM